MDIVVWYLSTCSTCQRILKETGLKDSNATLIDLKVTPLLENDLESMKSYVNSYHALINGRSTQFRTLKKKARDLTELESRELLLEHYAFLKRPIVRINSDYYIGNSKGTVEAIKDKLNLG